MSKILFRSNRTRASQRVIAPNERYHCGLIFVLWSVNSYNVCRDRDDSKKWREKAQVPVVWQYIIGKLSSYTHSRNWQILVRRKQRRTWITEKKLHLITVWFRRTSSWVITTSFLDLRVASKTISCGSKYDVYLPTTFLHIV